MRTDQLLGVIAIGFLLYMAYRKPSPTNTIAPPGMQWVPTGPGTYELARIDQGDLGDI